MRRRERARRRSAPRLEVVAEEELSRRGSRAGYLCVYGSARPSRSRILVRTLEGVFEAPTREVLIRHRGAPPEVSIEHPQLAAYWRATQRAEAALVAPLVAAGDWIALSDYWRGRLAPLWAQGGTLLGVCEQVPELIPEVESVLDLFELFGALARGRFPHADVISREEDVKVFYRERGSRLVCPRCGAEMIERRRARWVCAACSPREVHQVGRRYKGRYRVQVSG
jgi:ribosomal protein L37AE/L43A